MQNCSVFDFSGSLDSLLNVLHGRQLLLQFLWQLAGDLIGADADGFAHILQRVFCDQIIFALAEQQPDRWIILFFFQNSIDCRKIEIQPATFSMQTFLKKKESSAYVSTTNSLYCIVSILVYMVLALIIY